MYSKISSTLVLAGFCSNCISFDATVQRRILDCSNLLHKLIIEQVNKKSCKFYEIRLLGTRDPTLSLAHGLLGTRDPTLSLAHGLLGTRDPTLSLAHGLLGTRDPILSLAHGLLGTRDPTLSLAHGLLGTREPTLGLIFFNGVRKR